MQPESLQLLQGDTSTITASTVPSGLAVTWASDDETVATVDGGTVSALAEGAATITASMVYEGQTYSAACEVTVNGAVEPSIDIEPYSADVHVDDAVQLTASTVPTGSAISWSSDDPEIATVNQSGLVTGRGEGTAIITGSITVDGVVYSDTCSVNVTIAPYMNWAVQSIAMQTQGSASFSHNQLEMHPEDYANVEYDVSNPGIVNAQFDANGRCDLTALAAGECAVTASWMHEGQSYSAEFAVTVEEQAPGVYFDEESPFILKQGVPHQIAYHVVPADAEVQWSTETGSSSRMAYVDQDGVAYAIERSGRVRFRASIVVDGETITKIIDATLQDWSAGSVELVDTISSGDNWLNDDYWLLKDYTDSTRQTYIELGTDDSTALVFRPNGSESSLYADLRINPDMPQFEDLDYDNYDYFLVLMPNSGLGDTSRMSYTFEMLSAQTNRFKWPFGRYSMPVSEGERLFMPIFPNNATGDRLMSIQVRKGNITGESARLQLKMWLYRRAKNGV